MDSSIRPIFPKILHQQCFLLQRFFSLSINHSLWTVEEEERGKTLKLWGVILFWVFCCCCWLFGLVGGFFFTYNRTKFFGQGSNPSHCSGDHVSMGPWLWCVWLSWTFTWIAQGMFHLVSNADLASLSRADSSATWSSEVWGCASLLQTKNWMICW